MVNHGQVLSPKGVAGGSPRIGAFRCPSAEGAVQESPGRKPTWLYTSLIRLGMNVISLSGAPKARSISVWGNAPGSLTNLLIFKGCRPAPYFNRHGSGLQPSIIYSSLFLGCCPRLVWAGPSALRQTYLCIRLRACTLGFPAPRLRRLRRRMPPSQGFLRLPLCGWILTPGTGCTM